MDVEILQKYKAGVGGDYTLVYKSEGKDDPFGDMPIQNAEELGSEIAINLTGEVTMAATMGGDLEKLLDSYGNSGAGTMAAYTKSSEYGSAPEEVLMPAEEGKVEEAQQKPQTELGYECMACEKVYKLPGICEDCKVVLRPHAE